MSYNYPYHGNSSSSSSQQHELHALRFYRFHKRKNCWKHYKIPHEAEQRPRHHDLQVITWNVDFQAPRVNERMIGAIDYLRNAVLKGDSPPHCVILLQEVHSKALPVLLADPWIQKYFFVTPIDNLKWPVPNIYGNITLIERSISIKEAGILYFAQTTMSRTAIVTDIRLAPLEPELYRGRRDLTIRIVNTHLESLKEGNSVECRAEQLIICAKLLRMEDPAAYAGIIGGDFNAIDDDAEEQIHDLRLSDPGEPSQFADAKEFHTWGFHETKPLKFPTCRMDKIVFTPHGEVTLDPPVIFGKNAKTEEEEWVSDHYGLLTTFSV
ncbi:MAG: Endonuclease/exonuclease/phosphatase [Lentinula lateritia]|uniref:Endonuclease/exonuclease/phosphatase n=1 Tax=Lentinula lateritia TaxID=40482 RepID=A0ABQ8VWN7_9AGAR|nr:MAG: Endonuclease/exonuclease/phosphatase [Lentinula lateritia]KAJ4500735.1 Endonuclease/exonuclease/phosphatase [Lentinula lateritia]